MLSGMLLLCDGTAAAVESIPVGEPPPEPVTLSIQGAEVRELLQILGEQGGRDLVVHDAVSGRMSLNLEEVPWAQALSLILDAHGLAWREREGSLFIAPEEVIHERESRRRTAAREREAERPRVRATLPLHYADAETVAPLLDAEAGGLLSADAAVAVDTRTNRLLLRDTAPNIAAVRELLATIDVPARQVMIEARIVIARHGVNEELGARFGVSRLSEDGAGAVSGSLGGAGAILRDGAVGAAELSQRLAVDLPVAEPSGQLAVAVLDGGTLLDMELSALQAEGRSRILSNPRILTASQHEASIEQGVQVPYQQSAGDGATSVAFKRAVLRLDVRPRITPEEDIIMELRVNKDSVGDIIEGVPSIDTRELRTRTRVADGETVVLGGIHENQQSRRRTRVPLLGRIPLLGRLFRHSAESHRRSELLIFITPRLVAPEEAAASRP
ncbi:MAG: type IV pilus secretin PilQ [Pseudomonadota bacterium]